MELCYWAQEWYKQGDPEQMELKLVFEGIENYDGITGDIDYSILVGETKDNKYHFFIIDDFYNAYYEYYLEPSNVEAEIIRMFNY